MERSAQDSELRARADTSHGCGRNGDASEEVNCRLVITCGGGIGGRATAEHTFNRSRPMRGFVLNQIFKRDSVLTECRGSLLVY